MPVEIARVTDFTNGRSLLIPLLLLPRTSRRSRGRQAASRPPRRIGPWLQGIDRVLLMLRVDRLFGRCCDNFQVSPFLGFQPSFCRFCSGSLDSSESPAARPGNDQVNLVREAKENPGRSVRVSPYWAGFSILESYNKIKKSSLRVSVSILSQISEPLEASSKGKLHIFATVFPLLGYPAEG